MSNGTPGNNNAFDTGVFACFDVSGFRGMTPIQFRIYKDAWNTFNRVQSYNSNISTLRAGGNKILKIDNGVLGKEYYYDFDFMELCLL